MLEWRQIEQLAVEKPVPWNHGSEKWWRQMLARVGAIWVHDGNPRRPYALLTNPNPTTGKQRISNVYFDGAKLAEHPKLLQRAAEDLVAQLSTQEREQVDIVCGSPYGSITLAYAMALALSDHKVRSRRDVKCLAWFTEPSDGKKLLLKRFGPSQGRSALVVDDAFTTGGTSERTAEVLHQDGAVVMPVLPYLVNRPGVAELNGRRVVSIIGKIPEAQVWDEGSNPFTHDGTEPVPPVKPKFAWGELTKQY